MPQYADDALSHMRDEDVVALAQAGSDAAMEHMLRRYERFVSHRTRSFYLPGGGREDVLQEGMIGLFKAVRDHAPGMTFRTFASLCITRQITSALKTATRNKQQVLSGAGSLDDVTEEGDLVIEVMDERTPEADVMSAVGVVAMISLMRSVLSPLESATAACMIQDDTYAEAASRMGVPLKSVDNARQRVRTKLQRVLEV